MTPFLRPLEAALLGSLLFTATTLQNPPQAAAPQQAESRVAIIGCVERALPALPDKPPQTTPPVAAQQTTQPAAPRMYKLIDTQPGGGSPVVDSSGRVIAMPPAKAPAVVEPQYWLAGSPTTDFAKYQNQRVEVIGTLSRDDTPTPPITEMPPQDAPKSTLTVVSVRVISTECK